MISDTLQITIGLMHLKKKRYLTEIWANFSTDKPHHDIPNRLMSFLCVMFYHFSRMN